MREVVITRKYQITIPKEIREKLGLKVGDRVLIYLEGDKIVIKPVDAKMAFKDLITLADRFLGGPKRIDAVKLVEESLERETGVH